MSTRADTVTDFTQFTTLRAQARNNDPAVVRKAAQQFEALFTQQLLKSMRASSLGDDVMGGGQTGFYQDLFDQQMATHLSSSGKGLGLADVLVQQLRGLNAAPAADETQAAAAPSPETSASVQSGIRRLLQHSVTLAGAASSTAAAPAGGETGEPVRLRLDSRLRSHESESGGSTAVSRAERISAARAQRQAFVEAVRPHAERAAEALGVSPQVLIAQAALETGWGKHALRGADGQPAFNFFGIKADKRWQGDQVKTMTTEFVDGQPQRERAAFRTYGSTAESFDNYVDFLKSNPRYRQALQHGGDMGRFAAGLQKAGYATDPAYAQKLMKIANGATLRGLLGDGMAARAYAV